MPTLTTKLEAVNAMLGHVGETPVNSIVDTSALPVTAAIAVTVLDEASREIQSEGWHFNTENNVKLTPNAENQITLQNDVLELDTADISIDIVQRGSSLYDRKNNTTEFTGTVTVNLIRLLAWESLPETARRYITLRASRIFQSRVVGSAELEKLIARDEYTARGRLLTSDGSNSDRTIFDNVEVGQRIGVNRNYSIT
jgi:hypothetical protein